MGSNKPSLYKQLLGAVVGSAVALALYYSYEFAAPRITAYVTLPPAERQYDLGDARIADESATTEKLKRIQSRNREVAERMQGADPADYKLPDTTWDTDWPTEIPSIQETTPAEPTPIETASPPVPVEDGWQDFIREPAPVVTATESAPAEVAMHSSAPTLPDSGIGSVVALIAAFGGATAVRFKPLLKGRLSRK